MLEKASKIVFVLLMFSISYLVIKNSFFGGINVLQEVKTSLIDYDTVYVYNEKWPSNKSVVISNGQEGVSLVSGDEESTLVEAIPEIVEQGTGKYGIYTGYLTGYGADCVGCTGVLACKTKEGKWLNIYNDGVYYDDYEYGSVRMVAAAFAQFPCGTIIEITDNVHETFTAVVMDTGSAMRSAYKRGKVHIDVAFPYENSEGIGSYTDFSGTVKFEVERWGW